MSTLDLSLGAVSVGKTHFLLLPSLQDIKKKTYQESGLVEYTRLSEKKWEVPEAY